MARRKRAEIAKAQAEAEGMNGITNGLGSTKIGENEEGMTPKQPEDPEHLIGFARLFSGNFSVGDEVWVLPPKFNPAYPHAEPTPKKVPVKALYLLMGRGLGHLQSVPAGVVFGIEGLEGHILKTGTLCSQLKSGINLAGVNNLSKPILRVALDLVNPMDLNRCKVASMYLTAGELHLERCLKDLQERYAKCEIQPGEPIVPYRERIVKVEEMEPHKNKDLPRGTAVSVTASKALNMQIRVRPLLAVVTAFLTENAASIRRLYAERKAQEDAIQIGQDEPEELETAELDAETGTRCLLSIFDRSCMKCLTTKTSKRIEIFGKMLSSAPARSAHAELVPASLLTLLAPIPLATSQGPLCREPTQGVAVFLESITSGESGEQHDPGKLTGGLITTVRTGIRDAFLDLSPRILLAMYSCTIQATPEVLGRAYDVLNRRRCTILSESLLEGTPYFVIEATLPVAESFGFSDEKRTSGLVQPMLRFIGFEILDDVDPFWVPKN